MDPQTLLASTAPLAGTTAVLVTAIRQGLPAIDGMRRVLALVGAVAVLRVGLCQPAPWTVGVVAETLLRALLVSAQAFGGVTLADRLVTKGGAAMGSAAAAATPPSSTFIP